MKTDKTIIDGLDEFWSLLGKLREDNNLDWEKTGEELKSLILKTLTKTAKEEYKRGHNDCLRELGKTGEKWQGNYL